MRNLLIIGLCLLMAACNPLAVAETSDREIERFHQRWNAGDVEAIWRGAHPDFRTGPTREQFAEAVALMNEALGDVQSSEREGVQINTVNGETTAQILMRTQFANGEGLETFTLRGEGEALHLLYYHVESSLLDAFAAQKPEGIDVYPAAAGKPPS